MKNPYVILPVLIATCLSACISIASRKVAKDLGWREAEYKVKTESGVKIAMADGQYLVADIYHPKGLKTAPTILVRVPLDDNMKGHFRSKIFGHLWAKRGYHVVIQGVRGRYGSEGKHLPFLTEREDGISTLEWINKQSWHNGRTGMWGGSYFGYTQWVLYDQSSLGLTAMFTHISSTSNYDMFYPGGSFALETGLFWATRSYTSMDTPHEHEALEKAYTGYDLALMDNIAETDIPFYNDWVLHHTNDSFWKRIDGENRAANVQVPVLMMAGWFDPYLPGQVNDFETLRAHAKPEIKKASRLIIGPWGHAQTIKMPDGYEDRKYRMSSIAYSLGWYDRQLSGRDTTGAAPVSLFVMGINKWREEQEFPLARTLYTRFYLNSKGNARLNLEDGALSARPESPASESFVYDPRMPVFSVGGAVLGARSGMFLQNDIEKREDVLVFSTDVLTEDTEVTGKIELVLYVSTSTVNTDFTAKLVDVFPDGRAYNLTEGILRRDYVSDTITRIRIALNPTSNMFLKQHRIRLEVSSSNYPRYSRNLNTGIPGSTEVRVARQTVYTGTDHPSHIILPLIPVTR
jgi:putative CocE/NonD family hydrolase